MSDEGDNDGTGGVFGPASIDKDGDGIPWWNDPDEEQGNSPSKDLVLGNVGGDGGGILPDWVTDLKPLTGYADKLVEFIKNPAQKIRNVVSGIILGGIAFFVEPWFDTILLLTAGSKPGQFAAEGEVYGIADFPVAFARLFGGAVAVPVEVFTSTLAGVIAETTPASQGLAEGVIMGLLVAGLLYVILEYGPTIALAGIETVPTVGPPLARILKGLR